MSLYPTPITPIYLRSEFCYGDQNARGKPEFYDGYIIGFIGTPSRGSGTGAKSSMSQQKTIDPKNYLRLSGNVESLKGKTYARFQNNGMSVDLRSYFSTPAGQAAARRVAASAKQ